ncbi:hypothetical protein J1N35_013404 [Gossypium stocksii]|uniref:Uncharacterized protein n=1 Tax=Gossypium stocksii TaxID=47602 RepID=A0A9D4A6N8_9ROSI|nr:hypothetical protein J1N35_013404 [Gossypium stocksii]
MTNFEVASALERPASPIPSELERVTKKVKNKDGFMVETNDQEMSEASDGKVSYEDTFTANKRGDVVNAWSLVDDTEILPEDVTINQEGKYPEIRFSSQVHDLIDKYMERVLIVWLLRRTIGYRALTNRL